MKRLLEIPIRVVHGDHFGSYGRERHRMIIKKMAGQQGNLLTTSEEWINRFVGGDNSPDRASFEFHNVCIKPLLLNCAVAYSMAMKIFFDASCVIQLALKPFGTMKPVRRRSPCACRTDLRPLPSPKDRADLHVGPGTERNSPGLLGREGLPGGCDGAVDIGGCAHGDDSDRLFRRRVDHRVVIWLQRVHTPGRRCRTCVCRASLSPVTYFVFHRAKP
jgi:hypothetical protein